MSSLTQIPPYMFGVDTRGIYGALFIGSIFAALLFGVTNIQAFIYVRTHAGEWTKFYRLVILFLWTLDAMQLALTVHCVYYYLVTNFANVGALAGDVWSYKLQVVMTVVTIHVIHLLYSYRIWIVGRDRSRVFRVIPGIIIILSSGTVIALVYVIYHHNPEASLSTKQWSLFMGFSVAVFLDILITCSLWYLLASSRTGMSSTDDLITRLICYTINCGSLTSICALLFIFICAAIPHNLLFLSAQFLMGKLYINSYIALLNTRSYLAQPVPDVNNSFEIHRESQRYSSMYNISRERVQRFPSFRSGLVAHPEVEVVPPTRPSAAVNSRKSILVTVEKQSFVDL